MVKAREETGGEAADQPILRAPTHASRLTVPAYPEVYDAVRTHASRVATLRKLAGKAPTHSEATGYGWLVRRVVLAYLSLSDGDREYLRHVGEEIDDMLQRLPEGHGKELSELIARRTEDIILRPEGGSAGRGAGGVAHPKRKGKPKGPDQSVAPGGGPNHAPIRVR